MQFIIDILEQPYNWFYSFSIFVSLGIWLVSALGIFHSDTGADVSHDVHVEGGSFFDGIGKTIGFGMVPTSVLLTLILFFQGVIGIALNEWLLSLSAPEGAMHYLVLGGNFLASLIVGMVLAGVVSRPLRYIFKDYGTVTKAESVVGKIAQVTSGKVSTEFGQATLKLEDGNTIEIAVRITEQQNQLEYGQKLLILDFDKERNVYLVEKYD
ncbi:MAG: hypothetical protein OHK0057_21890 [Thermoflexibacter sp.]